MEILSQTFLTVLLSLVSTSLIQSTISQSLITTLNSTASGFTPNSNVTSGSTLISTTTQFASSTSSSTTISPITPTISPTTGDKTPKWNLVKDGIYCILLQMQTRIYFSNLNISSLDEKFNFAFLENNTKVNMGMSSCYGPSKLMLDFEDQIIGTKIYTLNGSLAFTFQNHSTSSYNLESMELVFSVDTQKFDKLLHNMSIKVKEGQAYQCLSEDKIKLSDLVTIDLRQFEFEAFRNSNTSIFNKFDVCPKDYNISDIVPIAVGCALAGLVIIVLVVYLIGRRNRQRGYQSV